MKSILDLFSDRSIEYEYQKDNFILTSKDICLQLIPNVSIPDYHSPQSSSIAECSSLAIRLWEDIFIANSEVVKSRILSLLGVSKRIHARKTIIETISQDELHSFIRKNHLNVTISSKYRYGLFFNHALVAVAAFGRSCPIQDKGKTYRSHELIRYCSLLNYTVVGGLSKLIHYFINQVQPEHIMTSVDREWSAGKSYLNLGFKVDGYTPAQEFWLPPQGGERIYSMQALHDKTSDQLIEEGYKRISNLGNIRLVKFI